MGKGRKRPASRFLSHISLNSSPIRSANESLNSLRAAVDNLYCWRHKSDYLALERFYYFICQPGGHTRKAGSAVTAVVAQKYD